MNEVSETKNTHHPKFNEVLEIRSSYEKTVEQRISQELHEELVVGESHTVVHPGTGKYWSEWENVAFTGSARAVTGFILDSERCEAWLISMSIKNPTFDYKKKKFLISAGLLSVCFCWCWGNYRPKYIKYPVCTVPIYGFAQYNVKKRGRCWSSRLDEDVGVSTYQGQWWSIFRTHLQQSTHVDLGGLNENAVVFLFHIYVASYLSQTEQWWERSGFSNWQRSQNRMAEETHTGQTNTCPDHIVLYWPCCWQHLSTAVHLQSWCACRLAGPWLFSSGSPAGTLPDLPAAAALCQRGTDETTRGRTHKQHLWFINRLCYY